MPYSLLKGKKGLIFGALNDQSIAWKVAERAHEEAVERHAVARERVDLRRAHHAVAAVTVVAPPRVVGQQDHDVGLGRGGSRADGKKHDGY